VRRCTVLLEYEIVTGYFLDAWQQLLIQQYFMIIVAVNFDSRLHKKNNFVHPISIMIWTIPLVINQMSYSCMLNISSFTR